MHRFDKWISASLKLNGKDFEIAASLGKALDAFVFRQKNTGLNAIQEMILMRWSAGQKFAYRYPSIQLQRGFAPLPKDTLNDSKLLTGSNQDVKSITCRKIRCPVRQLFFDKNQNQRPVDLYQSILIAEP